MVLVPGASDVVGFKWHTSYCYELWCCDYNYDNLTAFVDFNGLQIDGDITAVMNPTPHDEKFLAFGWNVITVNAHDFSEIESALASARATSGKPTLIIAKSVKGKGVSFMENRPEWHGQAPKQEQYEQAIADLDKIDEELGRGE